MNRKSDEKHEGGHGPRNEALGHYRQVKTGELASQKMPEGVAYQQSGEDLPQLGRPLEEMTRAELVEIARTEEIDVDESMSRDDLIATLRVTPGAPGSEQP